MHTSRLSQNLNWMIRDCDLSRRRRHSHHHRPSRRCRDQNRLRHAHRQMEGVYVYCLYALMSPVGVLPHACCVQVVDCPTH